MADQKPEGAPTVRGEKALALAERIGETLLLGESLLGLTLTALRRHDVEAVRSLAPRAMAAASAMGISQGDSEVKACLAWLACRQLRHPAQQWLPDELDSMAEAASAAWAQGQPEIAGETLAAALALARDLRYF
jgi:hypothetical protein